ncbi:uncharacterized protein LOC122509388 isoform X2 [Leptopilina heterotoma]|uniref:uncharacterized protein LOC122509388 isoform X2 n=1 Tax=Leptopilina heterotoma TaxID=63436 RepID=UPI001CA9D190|nr:uncharacterized protein LOC122509388 isoform X2 [Leptopilina heterotoma]
MNLALHGLLLHVILSMILDFQNGFGLCSAGEPGYLDFDNLPETNFSCQGKVIGGYYADVEAGCQMFHVCTIGQKDEIMDIKFLCLNGTVFDQETRVCERVDEVDCSKSERFYNLNLELYGNSAVTLSLHERDEDDLPPESLEEQQHRTSSVRPISTTTSTTTTSRPSQSSTTASNNNFQHSTGYPQVYQPQPAFPSVQSNPPKSIYDDKNGGYHHQYIYHNDDRNDNQATSYQLFNNQGVSSTTHNPQVHQVRYSSTPSRQIIHNEPSTVTPLFHTSSTIQTLLNNNPNGPSIINPIFHNHGISSTTEHYSIHSNIARETPEYQDNDDEHDEENEHIENEERRRLEPLQSTNKGKVSKLSISPLPQEEPSRSTIQTKTSQSSQLNRVPVNFLPTQSTIQTTSRTFYPTSRTSSKPQKMSSQRIMQQHIHVPPLPIIPNLKPRQVTINLSPPDIQKIVQNPPPLLPSQSRVIVTAKASVSDESGRPLNTSQLITLPLPTIPSSYDDYKEGDESFDPFYRDVPKIQNNQRIVVSSRSSRSPNGRIVFHRYKRDVSKGSSRYVQKVDQNNFNETEVSSIVRNLRKLKNIFFATDFDDSDEPNYFNAEEIPTNLGSRLKHGNTDYTDDNIKLATNNSSRAELAETKANNTKTSKTINSTVNRRNAETEQVDSIYREKDIKNVEIPSTLDAKNSENDYYDDQEEITNNRSKIIFENPDIIKPGKLKVEYYDEEEELPNINYKERSENITAITSSTTEEPEVEEYVYDPDELYSEEFYTSTKAPTTISITPKTQLTSENPTKFPKVETTTTVKSTTTPFLKLNSNNFSSTKRPDSLITEDYTETKGKISILNKEDTKSSEKVNIPELGVTESVSGLNFTQPDIKDSKSVNLNKLATKDTVTSDSALKKESKELLETKSSSNRKKSKSSESTEISEEKIVKHKRPQYSEEEEEIDIPNKSRRKNKYIPDFDYLEDDDYEDYSEERRLERRKQNNKRRKAHSQSRSRLNDYDTDDLRSRSFSSRRNSQRGRKTDDNKDRGKSYKNVRGRKKPILVESESEELDYPSEDYYSDELKNTSLDDDSYEYELERERNQRNKGRRNKGLRYEDPHRRSNNRRKNQSRKFRDEYADYDSREASTFSSREDESSSDWYYPTSKELPDDSQTDIIEEVYTEDSRNLDDVTTSVEDLTTELSSEEETSVQDELPSSKDEISSAEDVTSSIEDEVHQEDVQQTTEKVLEVTGKRISESNLEESKTEGVLKFTDELSQDERLSTTTETTIESPMKDQKQSSIKDMQDYVDDNYEPNNYKGTKMNKYVFIERNTTEEQLQNNDNKDLVELKKEKETKSRSEEQVKLNDKNIKRIKPESNDYSKHELGEMDLTDNNYEMKLNKTKIEKVEERETTTTTPIITTSRTTRRGTRSTTKATARTTPPKLFKPLTGKRNYLFIPPSTTPLPVVIKRRISLVHPRPAKPPKSYNELAPKPVIRKKLLEARKSIIETTLTSTTSEYEDYLQMTPEPIGSSENSKSQIVTEDNLQTTSETVLEQKIISDNLDELFPTKENYDNSATGNSTKENKDKAELENKINRAKIENKKIDDKQNAEIIKEKTEELEEDKNERKETTAVDDYIKYPYLLSKLSTTTSTEKTTEGTTKETVEKIKKDASPDTVTSVTTEVPKLTTEIPKSIEIESTPFSKPDKFEPKSESTKPEITLLRSSIIQKTSKRTKKEPSNVGGTYQGFNCLGKEMYRFYGDKRDCRLFHYCSPGFTSSQVLDFKFVCEQGTHFDESTQSCRHNYKNSECTVRIFW